MSYNTPNVLLKNFFGCSIEQDVPILSPPASAKADRDTLLFHPPGFIVLKFRALLLQLG